jgi:hypothetical protein
VRVSGWALIISEASSESLSPPSPASVFFFLETFVGLGFLGCLTIATGSIGSVDSVGAGSDSSEGGGAEGVNTDTLPVPRGVMGAIARRDGGGADLDEVSMTSPEWPT